MKKLLLIILLALPASTLAQDPILYEYDWYLWDLFVDGSSVPIPSNSEVEFVTLTFLDEDPDYFQTSVCNDLFGNATIDDFTMTFTDMGITLIDCTNPDNSAFEFPYFDFFFLHEGQPFEYGIGIIDSPEDGDGFTLKLTNPDGDLALYGDKPGLSVPDNIISNLRVYPNPAAEVIHWNTITEQQVTITVYSVLGEQMLNKKQKAKSLDVSMLTSGLYFIEISSDTGLSRSKFFKR